MLICLLNNVNGEGIITSYEAIMADTAALVAVSAIFFVKIKSYESNLQHYDVAAPPTAVAVW